VRPGGPPTPGSARKAVPIAALSPYNMQVRIPGALQSFLDPPLNILTGLPVQLGAPQYMCCALAASASFPQVKALTCCGVRQSQWTIKARVTNKAPKRSFSRDGASKSVCSIEVVDDQVRPLLV